MAVADSSTDSLRPDDQQLAGDYFVGASVFLFQRTVLTAFASEGTDDSTQILDAGAIVLAREKADDESGSVALQAILGWLDAWLSLDEKQVAEGPPGFDRARRLSLVCLAFGSDPEVSRGLADRAGFDSDDRNTCIARYAEAQKKWSGWLKSFHRAPDAPAPIRAEPEGAPPEGEPTLRLAFAPTLDEADQAIADAMRENGLFQLLTDDINATLVMPRPITALITQCGEAKAFYNPDRGEAVLCYEMLGALVKAAP